MPSPVPPAAAFEGSPAAPRLLLTVPLGLLGLVVLGALAVRGASEGLLTTPPNAVFVGVLAMWVGLGVGCGYALAHLPVGRLGRRLLIVAALSVSGWAAGTLARGATAWVAFAEGPSRVDRTVWLLVGPGVDGAVDRSASSPEFARSVAVRLTPEAASAARGFACVRLDVERASDGAARVVVPDDGVGPDAIVDCPS